VEPGRHAVTRVLLARPVRCAVTRVLLAMGVDPRAWEENQAESVVDPCAARQRDIGYPSTAWGTARLDRASVVVTSRGSDNLRNPTTGPLWRKRSTELGSTVTNRQITRC
jgi:hypothetical protein